MKIKVDKEEYENLLNRVKELEEYRKTEEERYRHVTYYLQSYLEDFFKHKCMTVMVKRDRNIIEAEVRKNIMDNLFKEEEWEN